MKAIHSVEVFNFFSGGSMSDFKLKCVMAAFNLRAFKCALKHTLTCFIYNCIMEVIHIKSTAERVECMSTYSRGLPCIYIGVHKGEFLPVTVLMAYESNYVLGQVNPTIG